MIAPWKATESFILYIHKIIINTKSLKFAYVFESASMPKGYMMFLVQNELIETGTNPRVRLELKQLEMIINLKMT